MGNRYVYTALLFILFSCSSNEQEEVVEGNSTPSLLFTELKGNALGINFSNAITEDSQRNIFNYEYFYNGGGVAVIDVNNDGLYDLFFTGNMVEDRLYLNLGNMMFQDITASAGVGGGNGWSTGATVADVNTDGFYDIYVSRSGPYTNPIRRKNHLFINNGNSTFTESALKYGLDDKGYGTQAAFFDYDKDGDLDMYQTNHALDFNRSMTKAKDTPVNHPWSSDRLYRNNGDLTFTDVTKEAGVFSDAFGLGLAIGDLNQDNLPDIYVANDFIEADFMYLNNGDGTFSNVITESTKHISNYGMGVDIADINNDAHEDIIVLDMLADDYKRSKTMMATMNIDKFWESIDAGHHYQYMRNTLQLNNGNMSFSEIGQLAGVAKTDWSWAPLLADFNNDGYKDLFVTNGFKRDISNQDFRAYTREQAKTMGGSITLDVKETLSKIPSVKLKNYLFLNQGNLQFHNAQDSIEFGAKSFSNGAAYADLDNDGDLEIISNNINDPVTIYKNNSRENGNSNYLDLELPRDKYHGSKITIEQEGQSQTIYCSNTRGYLSAVSPRVHFGLGIKSKIDKAMVTWPDGEEQVIELPGSNGLVKVAYFPDTALQISAIREKPMFSVVKTNKLSYGHFENTYNDFENEILLPHKMSALGPFMSKGDVNQDGLDDIFLGGTAGNSGIILEQTEEGVFDKAPNPFWQEGWAEDMGSAIFDSDGDGDLDLYVVSGGNEHLHETKELLDRLYLNDGAGQFSYAKERLPDIRISGSCVRPCDFDNDGDLDLFIGGRQIPRKYPLSPGSFILENNNGFFSEITKELAPTIRELGMVTDAVWSDVNGDKQPDLVVVGEWMPITVYINNGSSFRDATKEYALQNTRGWWNTIKEGDFDQDGDPDFVVGNLGLNSKYQASHKKPLHLYATDFDETGTIDIVLAKHTDSSLVPIRGKECTSDQMPFIDTKYPSYEAFANADLYDMFGQGRLNAAVHLKAEMFESVYLENASTSFEIRPLPMKAQMSTLNTIEVADLDQSGTLDLILAGNNYAAEVETGRHDAGYGLVLLGDGKGEFNLLNIKQSGFFANGDVKSSMLIQTAQNQRILLIGNNSAALQGFISSSPR